MARTKKQKTQFRSLIDILNNPSDRAKLQGFIDEAVRCKTRIADENESIKNLRDEAIDKLGIKGKKFNQLVKMYYNNNFTEIQMEAEELEMVIELLTGNKISN
jgi:hypothetical protein